MRATFTIKTIVIPTHPLHNHALTNVTLEFFFAFLLPLGVTQRQWMRMIFPDLRLRHRRALHMEVKLTPAAMENESVAGVPTRVARRLPIAVRRRG